MKLAEALIERKSLQEKLEALKQRIVACALVQEGDAPAEDPAALLAELEQACDALETLIARINAANNTAALADGTSLARAIVRRDMLRQRRAALEMIVQATSVTQNRYMRTEVRFVPTLRAADLRRQIDQLAKEWRELDAQIQAVNWSADLIA